jgi:DNA ligase D-like protein (predicted 3'-phosphoesterase)
MVAAQHFLVKPTRNAIVRRLPRPRGSGFLSVRLYKRIAQPLWRRATHAPTETATRIKRFDSPRTVRMVIQEHHAKRAGKHYDIRIHLDGRAVSFAVPKAKWPEVGERLLAVRTPDHIEEYSDFEGRIPDGQMGAGTVEKVFDAHGA